MARICLIRQGHYPQDPRLQKEIRALVEAGHEIDMICSGSSAEARSERVDGVTVHRLPISRRRGSALRYVFQYAAFVAAAALLAAKLALRRRYDIVQVNNAPDALVFAALVPRLLGARVLLNLLECMPEFLAMKYRLASDHPAVRLMALVERASIAFADRAFTCNSLMRDTFVARGAPADKIGVVMLSADETIFDAERQRNERRRSDEFVVIYTGTLEESLGPDTVVRAVGLLKDDVPNLRLRIFGNGTMRPALERMIAELGLEGRVEMSRGFAPIPELVAAVASADVGVVPTKRNAYRDLTHSTKMFDLIAMRKPVIVARTRSVEAYFDDSCVRSFESANEHDLARAIRELHDDPDLRERLVCRAAEVSEPYRWVHQRARYLEMVDELAA